MSYFNILLISFGLALDSFAVSICKGLTNGVFKIKNAFIVAIWFSIFQSVMPVIGYLLGNGFYKYLAKFDHFIIFILLFIVASNMLKDIFSNVDINYRLDFKEMLFLAVATSLDALATGVTFSLLKSRIIICSLIIGIICFIISFIGFYIGSRFGIKFKKYALLLGSLILYFLAFKILFEHLRLI